MNVSPAVREALILLRRVENGAHIAPLIDSRSGRFPPGEMGRLTDLLYGVQRWRGFCDFVVERFSSRSLSRIDAEVLDILRLAIYQLTFSLRPPYAIVDEAVETARWRAPSSGAFINALLRKSAASCPLLELLPGTGEPAKLLSLRYSHPRWMVDRWIRTYGRFITEQILTADQTIPVLTLSVNVRQTTVNACREKLETCNVVTELHPIVPGCLTVTHGNPFHSWDKLKGLFYVQDPASLALGQLAASLGGDHVLDACGAPGGKSLALARLKHPRLHILNDVHLQRLIRARQNAAAAHESGIRFLLSRMQTPAFRRDAFDVVLLDVPCSATGTLGKNPEIKWRLSESDIKASGLLQRSLLEGAIELVRPGGWLVYSTCSLEPEENDDVVFTFLNGRNDCKLRTSLMDVPDYIIPTVDRKGVFRFFPDRTSGGFTAFIISRS
ncbi:MAG TPA: transcription antitermination factor NusB [Thermoanaerobaculia bacterium]|nr:transcription antitermination factor NusB [Thermoanaerobaculia bacterium]HUM28773.1 transcription antitermination factor NusB [Thermoanaerobaculia bacterium]HXK67977.1 transcription antitermination factor NusB [Thermoanaerobaculia bacterium]